jgi:hypothetical protein
MKLPWSKKQDLPKVEDLKGDLMNEIRGNFKRGDEAIAQMNARHREPRFKKGDFVKHQGKPWEVSGFAGGDLKGFLYRLTGEGGKTKNAPESELELWEE